jgi:hypothetical protein
VSGNRNIFRKIRNKTRHARQQTARRANHHTTAKANSARVPDPCSVLPALPTGHANARPMAGSASSGHAAPQSRDLYRHEPGGPRISRSRHAGITKKKRSAFPPGQSGRHILVLSSSHFDPKLTLTMPSLPKYSVRHEESVCNSRATHSRLLRRSSFRSEAGLCRSTVRRTPMNSNAATGQ